MEVTDAPEQLSEHRRLLLRQSWFEILQHFLGGGLAVHVRLEGYEVAHVHQQLVVLGGRSWGGAPAVLLFVFFVSSAGNHAEVISGFHLGQQGGGGEWGGA